MKKSLLLIVMVLAAIGIFARPAQARDEEHPKAKTEHRDPFKHHRHHAKGHGTHPAVIHHHAHAGGTPKPVKHEIARHESPKVHAKAAKQAQAQ
jgi:hypothetical protein